MIRFYHEFMVCLCYNFIRIIVVVVHNVILSTFLWWFLTITIFLVSRYDFITIFFSVCFAIRFLLLLAITMLSLFFLFTIQFYQDCIE